MAVRKRPFQMAGDSEIVSKLFISRANHNALCAGFILLATNHCCTTLLPFSLCATFSTWAFLIKLDVLYVIQIPLSRLK